MWGSGGFGGGGCGWLRDEFELVAQMAEVGDDEWDPAVSVGAGRRAVAGSGRRFWREGG